ncbi:hypothetical protein COU37_01840 [Candidatus Micrarchaeota archaeon CG10_big_fil_rev_8_21_14_0_10_45_29]|nr:MAG: hypothetical protein COU37_01840 [Candidatus Micrarchaeota archaeon CG10_big_fil_rev_8_21_14_0_10_45_29]
MKTQQLGIGAIIKELEKKEEAHDKIISSARPLVRKCANCIRMLHCGEIENAKKELASLEKGISSLPKGGGSWEYLLSPIMQEVVEAKLFLAAVEKKPLPDYKKLKVSPQVFLLGLCDAIGEFRRQMLEELKAGNEANAQYYFSLMNGVYEQISVVRFSNSVLPNFKRKQDVARGQVEMARSELLRAWQ